MSGFFAPLFSPDAAPALSRFAGDLSPAGVLSLVLLLLVAAAAMGPFLALIADCGRAFSGKVFHEKCAWQTAQSALVTGVLAFAAQAAILLVQRPLAAVHALPGQGGVSPAVTETSTLQAGATAGVVDQAAGTTDALLHAALQLALPGATLILLALCLITWNTWRKSTIIRFWAALPAVVAGCASLLWYFPRFFMSNLSMPYFHYQTCLEARQWFALMGSGPDALLLLLWTGTIGLCAAALFAAIWLMLRRNKADFGRDYYNFAMRFCARAAFCAVIAAPLYMAALGVLSAMASQGVWNAIGGNTGVWAGMLFAIPLLTAVILGRVMLSATPMRHKISVILALILLAPAAATQVLTLFMERG